jgi:hypothetical protein
MEVMKQRVSLSVVEYLLPIYHQALTKVFFKCMTLEQLIVWNNIVEYYSATNRDRESDKLVAISSLAVEIADDT